ncbi:MAG TPA: hypothetical protein VJ721_05765 [Chthoniobacterales bacterium]|nr:hypothetical protein [Chthoniobacterales bacterium]
MKCSRIVLIPLLVAIIFLVVGSGFAKNKPAYNRAFNNCSQKMQDAYADCLNKPYNGVEMCQNVANTVYKQCMRKAGFYARDGEVPNPTKNPGAGSGAKTSPSPTAKPSFSPKIKPLTDGASTTTLNSKSSPSPTPKHSSNSRKRKG